MKLKFDDAGHVVLQDGKPVYVHDDGKEIAFDAPGTVATITRLNGEAKGHRERAEFAEKTLKAFEGIDAVKARTALDTVANLDAKKLIDAGEVEKVKAEAKAAYDEQARALEAKYAPVVKERDTLSAKLVDRTIGAAFAGSKYIADKLAVPAPMVRATFGNAFRVEDDNVIAYGPDGKALFSRERPGEVAGFEEALSILVENSPFRDQILKGSGATGGGATGGGGAGLGHSLSRAAFAGLSPDKQMAHVKSGGKITD
jgi:hypothetical protein